MENSNRLIQFLRRYLRLIVAALLLILALATASSYGFIKIQVSGNTAPAKGYTYIIKRQTDPGASEFTSPAASLKRLVRSGGYEISVRGPSSGFFKFQRSSGFFRTTVVDARLSPEKSRQFVGDNPSPCMFYSQKLYSYECSESYTLVKAHYPATELTPAYTQNLPSGYLDGLIEGIVKTAEGNTALLQPVDAEGAGGHVALLLDNQLKPIKSITLDVADINRRYNIAAYKTGFLIYDADFTEGYYYQGVGSKPEKIEIRNSQRAGMKFVSLSSSGGSLIAVYSDLSEDEISDAGGNQQVKSEVLELGAGKRIGISRSVSSAFACGDRFCALSEGELLVYRSDGSEDFSISGVSQIEKLGNEVIVVRDKEVVSLDAATGVGSIDYSFGEYGFCGLQKIDDGRYVLCIMGGNVKSALIIDKTTSDTDSIDKKLAELRKLPFVGSASVSGKYIYVSPDLGEAQYIQSINGYGYDPSLRQSVDSQIKQAVAKLGIDAGKYQLINTLK